MTRFPAVCVALLFASPASPAAAQNPVETRVVPVIDTYHDEEVIDPYRWLEDAESREVQAWSLAQNERTRAVLDAWPGRDGVRKSVTAALRDQGETSYVSLTPSAVGLFALKRDPELQQVQLVLMPTSGDASQERVIVDPNKLDTKGLTSIEFFEPSPDGGRIAVAMATGGTQAGDLRFYDTFTGEEEGPVLPRVVAGPAFGDTVFSPDGSVVYYTRYTGDEGSERDAYFYQKVYRHQFGTPVSQDEVVFGDDLDRIAQIQLRMDPQLDRLLITVQNGDSGPMAHLVRTPDGQIEEIASFEDELKEVTFAADGAIFGVAYRGTPKGRIVRYDSEAGWKQIVAEQDNAAIIHSFWSRPQDNLVVTKDRIMVVYQAGGPSALRIFDRGGAPLAQPDLPKVSGVSGLIADKSGAALFQISTFTKAPSWYAYDSLQSESRLIADTRAAQRMGPKVDVVRTFATSKDGTKVPVTLLIPEGAARDGSDAMIVFGYGGYGISLQPGYDPRNQILFDHNVIYAVANLRGGGEYGESWHKAGMLTQKQNVFDDFIAVVEHLKEERYASRDRIGILGGSNGGLLMGAVLTQRPEIADVVVSAVGIYDMLRSELSPNGAANVPEFGSVADPEQYRALRSYSPYHAVRPDLAYPPVLLTTGENDPLVDPMHSRKFAARLQATKDDQTQRVAPVLLRVQSDAGHGAGSLDQAIELYTDVYSFFFQHLGVQPKSSR